MSRFYHDDRTTAISCMWNRVLVRFKGGECPMRIGLMKNEKGIGTQPDVKHSNTRFCRRKRFLKVHCNANHRAVFNVNTPRSPSPCAQ